MVRFDLLCLQIVSRIASFVTEEVRPEFFFFRILAECVDLVTVLSVQVFWFSKKELTCSFFKHPCGPVCFGSRFLQDTDLKTLCYAES